MILYIAPSKKLANYISCYWYEKNLSSVPSIFPGTGAELIFYPNYLSSSIVVSRYQSFYFEYTHTQIFSVRIRHHALRYFFPMSIQELGDKTVSVTDIWGKEGQTLLYRLAEAINLYEMITLVEDFLFVKLMEKSTDYWLDSALNILYNQEQNSDNLSRAIISSEKSVRQFQNIIKRSTGVSPKYFQRTARFQYTLRKLLSDSPNNFINIALDYGYYDQAHFIKDFRYFTGQSPLGYFKKNSLQGKSFSKQYYVLNRHYSPLDFILY